MSSVFPVTFASILASVSSVNLETPKVSTYIMPSIAGQWEVVGIIPKNSEEIQDNLKGRNKDLSSHSIQSERLKSAMTPEEQIEESLQSGKFTILTGRQMVRLNNKSDADLKVDMDANTKQDAMICKERYNFAADNQLRIISGEEVTHSIYHIYPKEDLNVIFVRTLYDNNKADCSGNKIDQTGEVSVAFLKQEGNQMHWCSDPQLKHCSLKFRKVLP